eukprot:scaffold909_cov121-Isochrysis_galbana.AAC.8
MPFLRKATSTTSEYVGHHPINVAHRPESRAEGRDVAGLFRGGLKLMQRCLPVFPPLARRRRVLHARARRRTRLKHLTPCAVAPRVTGPPPSTIHRLPARLPARQRVICPAIPGGSGGLVPGVGRPRPVTPERELVGCELGPERPAAPEVELGHNVA